MFDQREKILETSGNMASSSYDVALNGKAFKVLMNAIYSDKIKSVVREIWSNALDSHIMAGKSDVPFEVNWPSLSDPTFHVRDFGIGLSPESMSEVYKTLFKSTKEDQKFQVGRYGLGSKTPFAYTDSFSIVSIYNKVKTYYSSVIKPDGIPDLYVMHQEVTDEGNGVTVSFSIEQSDIKSFQSAMKDVSIGFDVKPVAKNGEEIDWPALGDVIIEGIRQSPTNEMWLRQGPVMYPFDIEAFLKVSENETAIKILRKIYRENIVIDFQMDDLEMSASRESLQYGRDDPTVYSIERRILELKEAFEQKAKEAAEIDDFIEAANAYRGVFGISVGDHFITDELVHKRTGVTLNRGGHYTRLSDNHNVRVFSAGRIDQYMKNRVSIRGNKLFSYAVDINSRHTTENTVMVFVTHDRRDKRMGTQGINSLMERVEKRWPPAVKEGEETEYKNLIVVQVFDNEVSYGSIYKLMNVFDGCEMVFAGDIDKIKAPKAAPKSDADRFGDASTWNGDHLELDDILNEAEKYLVIEENRNSHSTLINNYDTFFSLIGNPLTKNPKKAVVISKAQSRILFKNDMKSVIDVSVLHKMSTKEFKIEDFIGPEMVTDYLQFVSDKVLSRARNYNSSNNDVASLILSNRHRGCLPKNIQDFFDNLAGQKAEKKFDEKLNKLFTSLLNFDTKDYTSIDYDLQKIRKFFERSDALRVIEVALKNLSYYSVGDFISNEMVVGVINHEIVKYEKEIRNG